MHGKFLLFYIMSPIIVNVLFVLCAWFYSIYFVNILHGNIQLCIFSLTVLPGLSLLLYLVAFSILYLYRAIKTDWFTTVLLCCLFIVIVAFCIFRTSKWWLTDWLIYSDRLTAIMCTLYISVQHRRRNRVGHGFWGVYDACICPTRISWIPKSV